MQHLWLVVSVLCGLVLRHSAAISRPTDIVLETNQYKHILVALNNDVPDDPSIIQKIKVG
jgi:hypothetical protein